MATSPLTFENEAREQLLNVIYAHWSLLGASFSTPHLDEATQVIDPEALVWASLEFLPTEPRLAECVLLWLRANWGSTIRQRFKPRLDSSDPRTVIWLALEAIQHVGTRPAPELQTPSEPCHGLNTADQVTQFSRNLRYWAGTALPHDTRRLGKLLRGPATSLLQAREVLGSDARHFLLLYLLCNPHGGSLKPVQEWTGYSSRTINDTAARWVSSGIASSEHGICRLVEPDAWEQILHQSYGRTALINWFRAFDACIHLLRALAKAHRAGLPDSSTVVLSHRQEACEALSSSALNDFAKKSKSLRHLSSLLGSTEDPRAMI